MAPGQREYTSSRSRSPTPSRSPSPHSQLLPTFPSSRDTSSTSRGGQTSSLPSSSSTLLTTPTTKLSPRIPNDFTQRDRERELPQLPSSVSGRGVIDDSEGMSSSTSPNLSIGIANGGSSLRNRVASSPRILQGFRGDGGGGGDDEKTPTAVAGEKRQSQMSIVEKNLYPTRSRSSRSTNANAKSSGTPARNENECSGLLPPDPTVSPGESPSKPGTGFDSRGYPARSTSSPMIASMGGNSSLTSGSGSGSSWGLGGDTSSTGNPKLVGLGVISTPLSNTNTSTSSTRDRPRQVLPLTGPRPRKQESNHMVTSKSHSYYPTPSSSWEEENESESENTTLDFSYPPIHRSTGNNVDSEGTFGSGSRTGTYEEPSLRQESYHENLYISDHDPSISRPDSLYTTRAHSPASSFGSDAPFGGLNGWGLSAKPKRGSYVEPESGKGEYLDEEMTVSSSYDTVAGAGADGSESGFKGLKQGGLMQKEGSKSFASLESSRFTMGRELNTPDYEGLAGRWTLPVDLSLWSGLGPEADDDIHDPLMSDRHKSPPGWRGFTNIGCISILILGLLVLFAGWPIISFGQSKAWSRQGSYNLGGINATGQLPAIMGNFGLIDEDTPDSASSFTSMETGKTWQLVFSDEFNRDGRSFYPGDDPYWEASDLHYWGTNNLEWYDPRAITTENGSLVITLSNIPTHGLDYQGGMMTTWNKFCFTGGYLEVNVSLPGTSDVYGLWPAIWTLGNLGRAGYGGSLEGLWPYSYNECDVGTLPNQTLNNLPEAALTDGDPQFEMALSYLSGQRLSRCTCTNDETHPGPKNPDGSFVGRAAPEIDVFEAQVDSGDRIGHVSQSAQWAPFNPFYNFINNSDTYTIYNDTMTSLNGYLGGAQQQSTSGLSITDQNCYTGNTGCFSVYGFEYEPGADGYITWVSDDRKAWTVRGAAMGPNPVSEVGQRHIPNEPMYIIMNLGISENFGAVDWLGLYKIWPVQMLVDYVRVYQDPDAINYGCDPETMPTAEYIARYPEAYANPNITTWDQLTNGSPKPKNSLVDTC